MRRSPRALTAWAAAFLVALVTARLVAADLATLHRSAKEFGAPRPTVVATRDLPLGTTVRAADLRVARLAGDGLPAGLLSSVDDAVGRVVAVPVVAGSPVVAANLADADRDGIDGLVPRGHRAVRVPADDGLVPREGSVVDVLVTLDPTLVASAGGGDPTVTVARAARVLAADGRGDGRATGITAAIGDGGVTLLVTEEEAHRLAFALAHGVVTLALAPPEDACCKTSSSGSSKD